VDDGPAKNEELSRAVNEAIERGLWPGEGEGTVRFRCECTQPECNEFIELTADEYERVRQDGRHFVVRPGHEAPEIEHVIERRPGYLIVQKEGSAADAAEASDPR
jgi:hypothetical protein